MERINKIVQRDHNLFLFGDDHEGTALRHDEGWEILIDMINTSYDGCKNNYAVDHGDIIEAIPHTDPRYDQITEKDKILQQIDNAVANREKIRDRLIVILDGNHPRKYWCFGNITKQVCDRLGVPYGTYSSHITYRTQKGNVLYRHYATHGAKSISSTADDPIRRDSNQKLILKRHLKEKFGDCVLMSKGHTHKLIIAKPEKKLYLTVKDMIPVHSGYGIQSDVPSGVLMKILLLMFHPGRPLI